MRGGLARRTLGASALVALAVAAVFAALLLAIGTLHDADEAARRGERALGVANGLERLVLDLETGARGFVIAGQERFLEPSERARARFPGEVARLRSLVTDPEQRERIDVLEATIGSYVAEWIVPVVERARRDPAGARKLVGTAGGKRRVDALRALFAGFEARQGQLSVERTARVERSAARAVTIAIAGLVGSALLIFVYAALVSRTVAAPVRRLAEAAGRLAGGDLAARVPEGGAAEVGRLASAFNVMAHGLQESRDELEGQNAELELQAAELEDRQARLESANDELAAQQAELERALAELGDEKERIQTFFDFGARVAAETELEPLARGVLGDIADAAGAEVGVLYIAEGEREGIFRLAAARGIDPSQVPGRIAQGDGLPGRALAEGRAVSASHPQEGLRLRAFGEDVALRHELHLPLEQGGRALGVLSLGRTAERPFAAGELGALEHLGGQAAVALSNANAYGEALRLAELNRTVLDATRDGIVLYDLEGRVILANAATGRLAEAHGLQPDVGRTLHATAEAVQPLTSDPDRYWSLLETIEADPGYEGLHEYELARSGLAFQLYTAPVQGREGAPIGRIVVLRDVSREREGERLKADLLATVSHELRTPLASVLGFAELLASRDLDEAARARYVQTIYDEARRLTDLVSDFLDLQRIEEGKLRLDLAPVDVPDLLRREVELFRGQSTAHSLDLELPAGPLEVIGDRERLNQVVANLLSNAIKYSPQGGRVVVAAAEVDGAVRVSVADPGLGIPAEQQTRIFEKFFRVDTSDIRQIGGTGLGLALCKEILDAHGGRIGFESIERRGSTFWFELPSGERRRTSGGKRILVVEDDPAEAALLSEWLTAEQYEVEVVASGEEALVRAARALPDIVCLDIRLAGELDGWDVLAHLKGSTATADVPVVICTGGNGRNRAASLGAADFLTKPFSPDALRSAVERLLPDRRGDVLIVDDDPAIRRLVAEALAREGIELREAATGEEALAEVGRERPDAIVLDLVMPGIDGFDVLERLQGNPATRNVAVLVLTAHELTPQERALLRRRAVAVLEKSAYSAAELVGLVERALGR